MSEWMREMDEDTDSPVGKHYLVVLRGCFYEASSSSEPDEDIYCRCLTTLMKEGAGF